MSQRWVAAHESRTMSTAGSESVCDAQAESRKSGRAALGDRGDSVWEWQVATGVFERDVTTQQLRTLEARDLEIVEFSPSADVPRHGEIGRCTPEVLERISRRTPRVAVRRSPGPWRVLWEKLRGMAEPA